MARDRRFLRISMQQAEGGRDLQRDHAIEECLALADMIREHADDPYYIFKKLPYFTERIDQHLKLADLYDARATAYREAQDFVNDPASL